MLNFSALPCLAALLFFSSLAASGQTPPQPVSVPPAIQAAKTVFISNAGADSGLFPSPFSGTPERAYQEFYATVQGWNRYRLVSDPAQADLVFELRLTAPSGPQSPNKMHGASDPLPMFRLVIYDRSTHYILWALTESVEGAALQKTHDRNFDVALQRLTDDLKRVGEPAP